MEGAPREEPGSFLSRALWRKWIQTVQATCRMSRVVDPAAASHAGAVSRRTPAAPWVAAAQAREQAAATAREHAFRAAPMSPQQSREGGSSGSPRPSSSEQLQEAGPAVPHGAEEYDQVPAGLLLPDTRGCSPAAARRCPPLPAFVASMLVLRRDKATHIEYRGGGGWIRRLVACTQRSARPWPAR